MAFAKSQWAAQRGAQAPGPELHAPSPQALLPLTSQTQGEGCRRAPPPALNRGPCCFFPSHPGWGSRAPSLPAPTRLSGSAQQTRVCRALCWPWSHPSVPKACSLSSRKGSPPGQEPWSSRSAASERVGQHRGLSGGQGPASEPPSRPHPEHLSPHILVVPTPVPGPRGQWNSRGLAFAQRKARSTRAPSPGQSGAWGVDTATPHCSSWHTTGQWPGPGQRHRRCPRSGHAHLQAPSTGVLATCQPGLCTLEEEKVPSVTEVDSELSPESPPATVDPEQSC